MPIKHILAPLTGDTGTEHVALCALHLAQRYSAHVTADFVGPAARSYAAPFDMATGVYDGYYLAMSDVRREKRQRARKFFDDAVAMVKLPIVSKPLCAQASTEWLDGNDDSLSALSSVGPLVDLIVINAPGEPSFPSDWDMVGDVLFALRRPALILPAGQSQVHFRRPVVAWNGGLQAAAAVRCGLDLFESQATVTVLQAGDVRAGFSSAERLIDHLGWHCFAGEFRRIDDESRKTGELILREAKTLGADVLVLGAYTHSRMREMVLGGVTEYMLRNADIPLLLAH